MSNYKKEEYESQQAIMEVILRIQQNDPSLSLIDAASMLCQELDIDEEEFVKKCGTTVLERLKKDAIERRLVKHTVKTKTVDSVDSFFA